MSREPTTDELNLNSKMRKLYANHKRYLDKIEELNDLPATRSRIKHKKIFEEKKVKAFHKLRFAVIKAVDLGYGQDWNTDWWYKKGGLTK